MLSSTYDADGNRKSLSAKIGSTPTPDFVNSYQYDSSNREVQVAQVQATGGDYVEGKLGKFTYDADGETSTIDRLRGASPGTEVVTSTYQYDSFGRTTNLTHSTTPTINDAWTYDADSEVKSFTDSANPGDNFSDCAYDDDGQLKSDTGGFEPVSNTYDDNGNATTGAGDSASAASVAPPVGATTFIVSNDATLSDAVAQIDLIPGGNYVITFSCSSISLCSPLSFYGDGTNVWIIGPGSGSLTINCASGSFAVTGGTTVNISGLTISGETSSFSNDGVLNLSSCTFTNNASDLRCGIYNDLGGSLSATSCTFSDNLGGAFAEIYNDIDCYAAITSCTFSDNVNTANTPGGAIENQGTMNIASSTFSGNSNSDGGAIANEGTLTITSSEFYDNNSSSYGGAISNSGPLSITSCTIADNSAVIGGGINNYDGGTANIAASTISGNTASLEGGGIANYDEAAMPIVNTIVAWNNSATGPDIFDSTGTVTTQNSLVRLAGRRKRQPGDGEHDHEHDCGRRPLAGLAGQQRRTDADDGPAARQSHFGCGHRGLPDEDRPGQRDALRRHLQLPVRRRRQLHREVQQQQRLERADRLDGHRHHDLHMGQSRPADGGDDLRQLRRLQRNHAHAVPDDHLHV